MQDVMLDLETMGNGTHHNAVDDAESQARHLIAMMPSNAEVTGGPLAARPVD